MSDDMKLLPDAPSDNAETLCEQLNAELQALIDDRATDETAYRCYLLELVGLAFEDAATGDVTALYDKAKCLKTAQYLTEDFLNVSAGAKTTAAHDVRSMSGVLHVGARTINHKLRRERPLSELETMILKIFENQTHFISRKAVAEASNGLLSIPQAGLLLSEMYERELLLREEWPDEKNCMITFYAVADLGRKRLAELNRPKPNNKPSAP